MRIRSFLFVPGDRPDRMVKAMSSDADAVILDLEDSVAPERKDVARRHVADLVETTQGGPVIFVRINALQQDMAVQDLAAALTPSVSGIVLPKAEGGECIRRLDAMLGDRDVHILAIVTETPKSIFTTGTYGNQSKRLWGLTWGAEDLSAALGASTAREADGSYAAPYALARSLTLLGAHAAGVQAIETVYPDFNDIEGLAAYAARGRRDGFSGMLAIHPKQVGVINKAFQPSEHEIAKARRIVALFAANPGAGALSIDGRMIDAPHLALAKRILDSAGR
jgi:citrate lyase subunit beta / citryl-CoA lyase